EMRKEYGYGKYPNVITAMQFERLLSSFGPTEGKILRPSDAGAPKTIGWIQCVGSRSKQEGFPFCSRVCCMYATKEAAIAKEIDPDIEVTIFFMDLRAYGKDFQQYYDKAKDMGVNYIRARPSSVYQNEDGSIAVRYMDTHTREVLDMNLDMLVLSTAIIPSKDNPKLGKTLGIDVDENGFFQSGSIVSDPIQTTRDGVYMAGCNQGPKDIPDSVAMASGAAARAVEAIVERDKVKPVPPPEQKDVLGEEPRIGVFVCHCGKNINGFLDCKTVADTAEEDENVVYSINTMFACSEDTQKEIREKIKEHDLNRVIVAACSPITHGGLFQDTLVESSLNKYLFEFANIRQHCSWVHSHDRPTATKKATDLVNMAIAKSKLLQPLDQEEVNVTPTVLVIGGGAAGMKAALALSGMNIDTHIIEMDDKLGGNLNKLHSLFPTELDPGELVKDLSAKIEASEYITVHLNTTLEKVDGFVGNFKGYLKGPEGESELEFGSTILASGFGEIDMTGKYGYGSHPKIMTQTELEGHIKKDDLEKPKTVVMVNCAGAMDEERPWCCRIGCGVSIKNAKLLKERYPDSDIYILYRDIRVFGKDEEEYFSNVIENLKVKIVRYSDVEKPVVTVGEDGAIMVKVRDNIYNDELELPADLLVLTAQTEGSESTEKLQEMFKIPVGPGHFFIEAHAKIRPLDLASDGVYFCGSAHFPKNLADAVAQAEGAASRAAIPIMRGVVQGEGITSSINAATCSSCGMCVEVCPYSAITQDEETGIAVVNAALCKGCGACAATCPSGSARQRGYRDNQILAMMYAIG
ncbi:MAG: CoB--CoM heterodisulfide reductase iron-sulfur subunit A family protein, partial [Thermoplasmata archaeon]|nr:CoB--CoM heterodisulfide reductase iron-sulfur subunit A family protein [Thermoplasmata archaeon]